MTRESLEKDGVKLPFGYAIPKVIRLDYWKKGDKLYYERTVWEGKESTSEIREMSDINEEENA